MFRVCLKFPLPSRIKTGNYPKGRAQQNKTWQASKAFRFEIGITMVLIYDYLQRFLHYFEFRIVYLNAELYVCLQGVEDF